MGNLLWSQKKHGALLALPPAAAVLDALDAGGERAVEWAGYVASRSPYSFEFWLGQAVGRAGLNEPYPINRALDAEKDAWMAKVSARGKKGKKR